MVLWLRFRPPLGEDSLSEWVVDRVFLMWTRASVAHRRGRDHARLQAEVSRIVFHGVNRPTDGGMKTQECERTCT